MFGVTKMYCSHAYKRYDETEFVQKFAGHKVAYLYKQMHDYRVVLHDIHTNIKFKVSVKKDLYYKLNKGQTIRAK